MNFAKRLLMVAGAVALAGIVSVALVPRAAHAIVTAFVTVANTSSNPVPTTAPTSVGVPVSKLLVLSCFGGGFCNQGQYYQAHPDGTASPAFTYYTLPAGKTFVVTDVQWTFNTCPGSSFCSAFLGHYATTAGTLYMFQISVKSGTVNGAEHFTTGVPLTTLPSGLVTSSGASVIRVTLYGYLTQ